MVPLRARGLTSVISLRLALARAADNPIGSVRFWEGGVRNRSLCSKINAGNSKLSKEHTYYLTLAELSHMTLLSPAPLPQRGEERNAPDWSRFADRVRGDTRHFITRDSVAIRIQQSWSKTRARREIERRTRSSRVSSFAFPVSSLGPRRSQVLNSLTSLSRVGILKPREAGLGRACENETLPPQRARRPRHKRR
jgi:hypothetical protein